MKRGWKIGRMLGACMLCLLFFSVTGRARDVWEQKDGAWYFYTEPDTLPENYERTPYSGWIHADGDVWYYAEASRMMTGWLIVDGSFYYFHDDGRMARNEWVGCFYLGEDGEALTDTTTPDGTRLSIYGSRMRRGKGIEELNEKTARYIGVLKEHPDARAELGSPGQVVLENGNGKRFLIFKTLSLYDRESGALLYSGDGAFEMNAVLERRDGDRITTFRATELLENGTLLGERVFLDPAGLITGISQRGKP